MGKKEFVAKDLTMGQLNALVKELGGETVVKNILNGKCKAVVKVVLPPLPSFMFHKSPSDS